MQRPKLRDNKGRKLFELYPLGQIPDRIVIEVGKWMAYMFFIGRRDIGGEDWGDIFAKAINGEHQSRPLGLADVVYEGMAWSVKTVQAKNPHTAKHVRLISGRNDIGYSFDIKDPFNDIATTGNAVLQIWNERVNIAKNTYKPLRTCVLVRNFNTLEFALFEQETIQFDPSNYEWQLTKNGKNFNGYDKITGKHKFVWQSGGTQFTIINDIPPSVRKFRLRRPPVEFETIMEALSFDPDWVTLL